MEYLQIRNKYLKDTRIKYNNIIAKAKRTRTLDKAPYKELIQENTLSLELDILYNKISFLESERIKTSLEKLYEIHFRNFNFYVKRGFFTESQ